MVSAAELGKSDQVCMLCPIVRITCMCVSGATLRGLFGIVKHMCRYQGTREPPSAGGTQNQFNPALMMHPHERSHVPPLLLSRALDDECSNLIFSCALDGDGADRPIENRHRAWGLRTKGVLLGVWLRARAFRSSAGTPPHACTTYPPAKPRQRISYGGGRSFSMAGAT